MRFSDEWLHVIPDLINGSTEKKYPSQGGLKGIFTRYFWRERIFYIWGE